MPQNRKKRYIKCDRCQLPCEDTEKVINPDMRAKYKKLCSMCLVRTALERLDEQ